MDLLQLKYFNLLAENQHLTRTAEQLKISSPSLSATIKRLENELGVQLFDRKGRNIFLNNYGEILLTYVKEIFILLENAQKELEDIKNTGEMKISVATTSPLIWHDLFMAFVKKYPNVNLNHSVLRLNGLYDSNISNKFDFIITAHNDLSSNPLWVSEILNMNDKPFLAVWQGHKFSSKKEISFIEAREEKFIALPKGFSGRKLFDDLCMLGGFEPKIVIECDYSLRSTLLKNKYGIVFTTESVKAAESLGDAVFIEITEPKYVRTQSIFWKKDRYLNTTNSNFLNFAIDFYKKNKFTVIFLLFY